jgi:ribosome-binding ATPase YchF (GTP1/OBG family)
VIKTDQTVGNSQSGSPQSVMEQVQAELALLQLKKLRQDMNEEEAKKASEESLRKARSEAVVIERAQREALQNACPHLKPNFRPAIAAQKDHDGHTHWLCLLCNKGWVDQQLPVQLRIPSEHIGGPQ